MHSEMESRRTTAARNEFASMPFATTKKQRKESAMSMKTTVISAIVTMAQSKWMRPAMVTLPLLAAVLVVAVCHH